MSVPVSVLDIAGRKTIAVIPISGNTQRIAMSRDGSMVFTADQKTQVRTMEAEMKQHAPGQRRGGR